MIADTTIRQLAERTAPDRCFLSIYVGPDDLDWLEERLDDAELVDKPTGLERENLGPTIEMARDWLDGHAVTSEGLALFACWADDFVTAYPLDVPVERRIVVDSSPFVLPLAEIADEFETWCVALLDHDAARIFEITGLDVDEVDRASGNIKNHVKVGGWSQQRYERRREKQIAEYCAEIADRLDALVTEGPCDRLFLAGNEHLVAQLKRQLPPRLADRVEGTESMAADLTANELHDTLEPLFDEAERRAERDLMDEIKEQRYRDGRAAIGPKETLRALRQGRVHRLLVDRNAEFEAVRCRDCEWLSSDVDEAQTASCPVCGGDVFGVDLTNELTELASRTDADVELADTMDELSRWGGAAALLRY